MLTLNFSPYPPPLLRVNIFYWPSLGVWTFVCLCVQAFTNPLPWFLRLGVSGICRGRKGIKGQGRRPRCLDSASHIPEIPRGPSPQTLQLRKPLCSLLPSDPEALGSSRLLTHGQSFLAKHRPPLSPSLPSSARKLSSLPWGGDFLQPGRQEKLERREIIRGKNGRTPYFRSPKYLLSCLKRSFSVVNQWRKIESPLQPLRS